MAATSAIYQSLDPTRKEIRLLTLHESKDPTKLFVKLETVPLTPETEYIALSYVWGDPPDSVDILINGIASKIRPNLASALECFHQHKLLCGIPDGRPLPLWVDAISINQSDIHEKNEQVAFMGEIYSSATHVFSWLGRPDEKGIDLALDLIRDITSRMDSNLAVQRTERLPCGYTNLMDYCYETDETTVQRFLEEISRRPDLCIRNSDERTQNKLWNAVQDLYFSPYWERVWIQQEMALARVTDHCHLFFCGCSHLSLRNLDMFAKLTHHASRVGRRPSEMDQTVWNHSGQDLFTFFRRTTGAVFHLRPIISRQLESFHPVFAIARNCKSKDPRDKLYALNAVLGLGLVPNYELPVKDVYLEWFRHQLEKVLSTPKDINPFVAAVFEMPHTSSRDDKGKSLPSWLPDLSIAQTATLRNSLLVDPIDYTIMPEKKPYLQGEVLNIYGCMCGTINSLYSFSISWHRETIEIISKVSKHFERFQKQQMKRQAEIGAAFESNLEKALTFTSFQGQDPRYEHTRKLEDWLLFANIIRYSATKERTLDGVSEILQNDINERARHIPEGQTEDSPISQEPFPASLLLALMLRGVNPSIDTQLFMTANGYVGRCHTEVRDDDEVCILDGANYPVVLRKVNDHWIFMGMCYVYGISYVKPSEVIQRDGLEGQWFPIH